MMNRIHTLNNSERIKHAYNSDPLSPQERIAIASRGSNLSNVERLRQSVSQPNIRRATSEPFFPQRSPSLCSEYTGISSDSGNFPSSDRIIHSSEIFRSSSDSVHSSDKFRSSDDILRYLKFHPDFQRVSIPPSQLGPIAATIFSSLALGLGVVMFVVSHIAVSPVLSLATSVVIGSGLAGLSQGISGIRHEDFDWGHFAKHIATNSVITLLTFGGGYATGGVTGLALKGVNLTKRVINAIGSIAGGVVGSGVKTGSYIVVATYIEDCPLEAKSVILNLIFGGLRGESAAGYLNVQVDLLNGSSSAFGAEIASSNLGNELIRVYESPSNL